MFILKFREMLVAASSALMGAMLLSTSAFAWDGWVQGNPDQLEHGAKGYFVWHNAEGWHLRTHDDPNGAVFSGRIRTNGTFHDVDLVRAESTEHLSVGDGGHVIHFRFKTYDHLDGLNFRVEGGSEITFDLETNGHQTARRHIFIGDAGRHPGHNPFTLERREGPRR